MKMRNIAIWTAAAVCMLARGASAYITPKLVGPFDLQSSINNRKLAAKVHVDSVDIKGSATLEFTEALSMVAHCTVISAIKGEFGKTVDISFVTEKIEGKEYGMPRLKADQTVIVFLEKEEDGLHLYPTVPAVAKKLNYTHGEGARDKLLDELIAKAEETDAEQKLAIEQLGAYADGRAADALLKLMGTVTPELRSAVMAAMIRVDRAPGLAEIKKYIGEKDVTRAIYERSAHPVNDPATGAPPQPFLRGVTGLDYAAYLRECLPLVKDEQVPDVMYAVWQVIRPETVPTLVELLDDKSATVRRWAVGCLRQIIDNNNKVPDEPEFTRKGDELVAQWKKWWSENQAAFLSEQREKYLGNIAVGLQKIADKRMPGYTFEWGKDRIIRFAWKTQNYDVHRRMAMTKDSPMELRHETGPAEDGVIMKVWLSAEANQAVRPQTLENDGKWKTDLLMVSLPWLKTSVYINQEYGAKPDGELLKLLRSPETLRAASGAVGWPTTMPASGAGVEKGK